MIMMFAKILMITMILNNSPPSPTLNLNHQNCHHDDHGNHNITTMLTNSPLSPTLSLPSLRAKSCPADIKRSPCRQFSFLFFLFLGGTLMPITLVWTDSKAWGVDLEDDNHLWWFVGGRGGDLMPLSIRIPMKLKTCFQRRMSGPRPRIWQSKPTLGERDTFSFINVEYCPRFYQWTMNGKSKCHQTTSLPLRQQLYKKQRTSEDDEDEDKDEKQWHRLLTKYLPPSST